MSNDKKWVTISKFGMPLATAALLFTGGCAKFTPSKTYSNDTPEHKAAREAYLDKLQKEQTNHDELRLDGARRDASRKIVAAACGAAEKYPDKKFTCARMLETYASLFGARNDHSEEEKAYVTIGEQLAQQGGTFDCSLFDRQIVCNRTSDAVEQNGLIAKAGVALQSTLIAKAKPIVIRITPNMRKVKMTHDTIAISGLVMAEKSFEETFSTEAEPPAEQAPVIAVQETKPAQEAADIAAQEKTPEVAPTVAANATPAKDTLSVLIDDKKASGNDGDSENKMPLIVGATAALTGLAALMSKKNKFATNSSASVLATAWSHRHSLIRQLNERKYSIIVGGLAGAGTRIGAKFILAKLITVPVVAAGAMSLPTVLAGIGIAASTAILAGAVSGAAAELAREAFNKKSAKEKGWQLKALRKGANTGALSGLIMGGVADLFMSNGFLNEYVGKPVSEFASAHMPDMSGVKSFFNKVLDLGSLKQIFAGANPLQQAQEATSMDVSSLQAVAAEPAVQAPLPSVEVAQAAAPTPQNTPVQMVFEAPASEAPAAPEVQPAAPAQTVAADAAAPTISKVPAGFEKLISSETYDLLGKDAAGRAVQKKMLAAALHPNDNRDMLGAIKEASKYLLNHTNGDLAARQAGINMLEKGHALIAENARLGGSSVSKMIERDYGYVRKVFAGMVAKSAPAL